MPKYCGKQIFGLGRFPEVDQKDLTYLIGQSYVSLGGKGYHNSHNISAPLPRTAPAGVRCHLYIKSGYPLFTTTGCVLHTDILEQEGNVSETNKRSQ